jgi:nucleotide-binding universal stress UspA family protein
MFNQVIVGVDGGPTGRDAVAVAVLLVAADGRLVLTHVLELTPVRGASNVYGPAQTAESMALLEAERDATGVDAELVPVTASSVGRGLHYVAQTRAADLLSVGSTTRSLAGRVLVGDITRAALIGAPCAVAIAPLGYASDAGAITKVGVGYDGSRESEAALAFARELAAHHRAALTAMTVVEPATMARGVIRSQADDHELDEAKRDLAALDGVEGEVASGLAGEELALFSDRVDVLVVGSRGYGPIRSLMLGGTAVHLASSAHCPLLVLPRVEDE